MKLLTAEEVAEMLQVKPSWVHERTRKRTPEAERIPHIRLPGGRYVRFNADEIREWMANGCKPGGSVRQDDRRVTTIGK